ncbi:KTSC domain-containing protein [Nitrospira sp. BLG_2]|uniref:KTSC domain-containing protein n=1 Tax=Nitrospira sp. BLG_2 TaxID=3397507 RepID=UPI003B9CBBAC
MRLIPVHSSGVRAVGYDEERKVLYVQFVDGDIYEYHDVPVSDVVELFQAHSIGWFVNKRIKPYYGYRKLKAAS